MKTGKKKKKRVKLKCDARKALKCIEGCNSSFGGTKV